MKDYHRPIGSPGLNLVIHPATDVRLDGARRCELGVKEFLGGPKLVRQLSPPDPMIWAITASSVGFTSSTAPEKKGRAGM